MYLRTFLHFNTTQTTPPTLAEPLYYCTNSSELVKVNYLIILYKITHMEMYPSLISMHRCLNNQTEAQKQTILALDMLDKSVK